MMTTLQSVIIAGGQQVSSIIDGRESVAVAGTAEPLSLTPFVVEWVILTAYTTNSDIVVVGGSTVVASGSRTGVPLVAGQALVLGPCDLADVWVNAVVNFNGVTWAAGIR